MKPYEPPRIRIYLENLQRRASTVIYSSSTASNRWQIIQISIDPPIQYHQDSDLSKNKCAVGQVSNSTPKQRIHLRNINAHLGASHSQQEYKKSLATCTKPTVGADSALQQLKCKGTRAIRNTTNNFCACLPQLGCRVRGYKESLNLTASPHSLNWVG